MRHSQDCPKCGGEGVVEEVMDLTALIYEKKLFVCSRCRGTGRIKEED